MQIRALERTQRGIENALIASMFIATLQGAIYLTLSAFILLGRWCSAGAASALLDEPVCHRTWMHQHKPPPPI